MYDKTPPTPGVLVPSSARVLVAWPCAAQCRADTCSQPPAPSSEAPLDMAGVSDSNQC